MYHNKRFVMDKLKRGLIAAALTVSLAAALPVCTVGSAQASLDLRAGSCSVAVERLSEKQQGAVVVDLYQVAAAEQLTGYDAYRLQLAEGYSEFEAALQEAMGQDKQEQGGPNALYRALAQKLAKKILIEGADGTQELPVPTKSIDLSEGNSVEGLDPGMYLVIAHGKELTAKQYMTYMKEEGTDEEKLATVAYSDEYVYTYLPELIALPMKGLGADTPEGSFGTDAAGSWLSDVTITLKSEESLALAGLVINKTFAIPEGVVVPVGEGCVYRIEATLNGRTVYSDVEELIYDGNASGTIRLEKIVPIGSEITVTEVYDGAAFDNQDGLVRTIPAAVPDDGDVINNSVSYVNAANGNGTGGDIVTNSFENGDDGWTWNDPRPVTVQQ